MNQAFIDYYRCPEHFADFKSTGGQWSEAGSGYFRLGADLICYGTTVDQARSSVTDALSDVSSQVRIDGSACALPFDPTEVANNFRYEHYVNAVQRPGWKKPIRDAYYYVRPALPVSFRRHLQRTWLRGWNKKAFPSWPVDSTVDRMFEKLMCFSVEAHKNIEIPFIWFWPDAKSSCAIVTHDVETLSGLDFAGELMDINDSFGIKARFRSFRRRDIALARLHCPQFGHEVLRSTSMI